MRWWWWWWCGGEERRRRTRETRLKRAVRRMPAGGFCDASVKGVALVTTRTDRQPLLVKVARAKGAVEGVLVAAEKARQQQHSTAQVSR